MVNYETNILTRCRVQLVKTILSYPIVKYNGSLRVNIFNIALKPLKIGKMTYNQPMDHMGEFSH